MRSMVEDYGFSFESSGIKLKFLRLNRTIEEVAYFVKTKAL